MEKSEDPHRRDYVSYQDFTAVVQQLRQSQPVIEPTVRDSWIEAMLGAVEPKGSPTYQALKELQQFRKAQGDLGK